MEDNTLQFIGILVTVAGLLGWLLKQVISYFIKTSNSKDKYIEQLVDENKKTTENFVNTINHQRTLDREMQETHSIAIRGLSSEIKVSNQVNGKMLELLKKNQS